MRELDLDLVILENERWLFENNEMQNEGILNYFKKNLGFDKSKGYFIINKHGELTEKAFIKVYGFPLFIGNAVIYADPDKSSGSGLSVEDLGVKAFSEKNDRPVFIPMKNIYRWQEDVLWTFIDRVPVRFKGAACVKLSQFWLEKGEDIFWDLEKIINFCRLPLSESKPLKIEYREPPLDKK